MGKKKEQRIARTALFIPLLEERRRKWLLFESIDRADHESLAVFLAVHFLAGKCVDVRFGTSADVPLHGQTHAAVDLQLAFDRELEG